MNRLAFVTTHPIQYYAPWFRCLAGQPDLQLKTWYLWDFGTTNQVDNGFQQAIQWDVPLLDGYDWEFVPNRSRRPGTADFWGIDNPELIGRLRAYDPSAVLCLGYNFATFARLLVHWNRSRSPLMLRGDSHRLVRSQGLKAWVKAQALKQVFRRFAAFLYVGKANRDYYRMHGVPDERLFFSPHSVDNERFMSNRSQVEREAAAWKRELGISESKRVVLFVGKFEEKKRPLDLLKAFARARVKDTALLFVGAGALEAAIRDAARTASDIYIAPFQNQSQMPRTYAAADVVVLPSFGTGETWGLCINEAMCLGKPVIVSTHVGCARDLVVSGVNGFVFYAGDVGSLSDSLRNVLEDRDRMEQFGRASFQRIHNYSYQKATEGLLQALAWLQSGKTSQGNGRQRKDDQETDYATKVRAGVA
ncbi:MAG: glycosyltransferase family 4 protein [Gemmataceae bacterium]